MKPSVPRGTAARGWAACCASALALASACVATTASGAVTASFSHAALDTVLQRHVHEGRVDYGGLSRDRGPLSRYLDRTRDAKPDGWAREEQIAFWVNAYNARVLDGVVRRPRLTSVLDVGRTLGVPTLGFFRERRLTAGRMMSLNDIEHGTLRKRFADARLHFVLNCASRSCPVLPARALAPATIDSVLTAAARSFLADSTRNRFGTAGGASVSAIFKWYREDFVRDAGTVEAYLSRYGPVALPPGASVQYLDYDWSLNGDW